MTKSEFIKELTNRVKENSTELLEEEPEYAIGRDFFEWLHYITDGGIEVLFYDI